MPRSRTFWLLALACSAAAPADAQMVWVVNVRQAIDSPLAKKKGLVDIVKAGIDGNPQAKQLFAALNLDLTKDIESAAFAIENLADLQTGKPEKMLAIIRGNFDPDRIDAVARKADTIKVSKEGTTTVYEFKDKDNTVFFTLIGKNIIAAAPSKDYLLKSVKNIGGGSKELVKASAKLDGKSSMWMAIVMTKEMRELMAKNAQTKDIAEKLESFTFGVKVSDDIVADMNINTSDAATAKAMQTQVEAALKFIPLAVPDEQAGAVVKEIIKGLKVTANQDGLNFNLKLTEATLDMIIKLAQMK